MTERISRIRELLPGAVLLPVASRKKTCYEKGWQKVTFERSLEHDWQAKLHCSANTAVLLGPSSGHLVTVDCDTDDYLERFLGANPAFRKTLITKGSKGGNVWLRMPDGCYPPTSTFQFEGKPAGEFRSTASYTMISGIHPKGMSYRVDHEAPPVAVRMKDIVWPEGTIFANTRNSVPAPPVPALPESEGFEVPPPSSESCILVSSVSPVRLYAAPVVPAGLGTEQGVVGRVKAFRKVNPQLAFLIDRLLDQHLPLQVGSRNKVLTGEIVPVLFTAVGKTSAWQILHHLSGTGRLGGYPAHELTEKCSHVWNAMEREYPGRLGQGESTDYSELDENEKSLYRICRSLASRSEKKGEFFLSCRQAGQRLSIGDRAAQRMLQSFCGEYGFARLLRKGEQWCHGKIPQASSFLWLRSLERLPDPPRRQTSGSGPPSVVSGQHA